MCGKSSQWTWVQGYGSPSQNAEQGSLWTQEQQPCLQSSWVHLLPGEWSSRKGSIHIKTKWTKQGLVSPPSTLSRPGQALIQPGTGLCVRPQFRTRPSPFPLDFLSHSLRFIGKQQEGKHMHQAMEQHERNRPALGDTAFKTRVSQLLWLKMSVMNNFLFKKYQVKCKL